MPTAEEYEEQIDAVAAKILELTSTPGGGFDISPALARRIAQTAVDAVASVEIAP